MSAGDSVHPGLTVDHPDADAHKEAEGGVFGFWVFLMSDAVIFALLFATYGVMLVGTAGGPTPATEYKIGPAFVETLILLTSSLTFGMASLSLKHDDGRERITLWLMITLGLGVAFLAMELHDFGTMAAHGAVPSRSGYLSAFFALVPLHGLHVLAGCVWIGVMVAQLRVFGTDERVTVNLLRLGLFWHFLDIVWIAIFSVVYLQGLIA